MARICDRFDEESVPGCCAYHDAQPKREPPVAVRPTVRPTVTHTCPHCRHELLCADPIACKQPRVYLCPGCAWDARQSGKPLCHHGGQRAKCPTVHTETANAPPNACCNCCMTVLSLKGQLALADVLAAAVEAVDKWEPDWSDVREAANAYRAARRWPTS